METNEIVRQEANPEAPKTTEKVTFVVAGMTGDAKVDSSVFETAYDRVQTGVKTTLESITQTKDLIHSAAMAAAYMAQKHGNVMPAHRLVMSLATSTDVGIRHEAMLLKLWFGYNTQVAWETPAGKVFGPESKPFQDAKKAYKLEEGDHVPFFATKVAKESEAAAQKAKERVLNPLTLENATNRVMGLLKWSIKGAKERELAGVQPFAEGEKSKIQRGLKAAVAAYVEATGVDVDVKEIEAEARKAA